MPATPRKPERTSATRVVVCGTTFGQVYMEAIQADRTLQLAGILANDSPRSRACGTHYGVPTFRRVNDVADVDLACVVVRSALLGGPGSEIARQLMSRGIHVLQEHPVHHDELVENLRCARRSGVQYHLNTFYPQLPRVRQYVRAARRLISMRPLLYIDAACSFQVAYALLDILRLIIGRIRPWGFTAVRRTRNPTDDARAMPLRSLDGRLGGVPLSLRIQHQLHPVNPDDFAFLLHRITVGTEAGELTLVTSHGPILWCGRPAIPREVLDAAATHPYSCDDGEQPDDICSTLLSAGEVSSQRRLFREDWPAAAGCALRELRDDVIVGGDSLQRGQQQLTLCRVWQEIVAELGAPELLHDAVMPRPLTASDLISLRRAADDACGDVQCASAGQGDPHRDIEIRI